MELDEAVSSKQPQLGGEVEYWDRLPNEMKLKVIKHTTYRSRNSLRCCSKNAKGLADRVPFNILKKAEIVQLENDIIELTFSDMTAQNSVLKITKEELRKKFLNYDFIAKLELKEADVPFPRISFLPKNMAVGSLTYTTTRSASPIEAYVKRMDDSVLKELLIFAPYMARDFGREEFFDLPQVMNADKLRFTRNCLTDEKLLLLKARNMQLGHCENITNDGWNKYIEKILRELNHRDIDVHVDRESALIFDDPIFEGLDVVSTMLFPRNKYGLIDKKKVMIRSPHPGLFIRVLMADSNFFISRIVDNSL